MFEPNLKLRNNVATFSLKQHFKSFGSLCLINSKWSLFYSNNKNNFMLYHNVEQIIKSPASFWLSVCLSVRSCNRISCLFLMKYCTGLKNVRTSSLGVKIRWSFPLFCRNFLLQNETYVAYGGATWRVMFEKIIGPLSSVPPLARWRDCVPIQVCPLLIRTLSEVDSWKTIHPSAKVT